MMSYIRNAPINVCWGCFKTNTHELIKSGWQVKYVIDDSHSNSYDQNHGYLVRIYIDNRNFAHWKEEATGYGCLRFPYSCINDGTINDRVRNCRVSIDLRERIPMYDYQLEELKKVWFTPSIIEREVSYSDKEFILFEEESNDNERLLIKSYDMGDLMEEITNRQKGLNEQYFSGKLEEKKRFDLILV